MKRRKAIKGILLVGTATAIGIAGYEWYSIEKRPDINYLVSKKKLIAELADAIIPTTATPGAIDAGAIEYLMPLLTECTDRENLNQFIEGLNKLEDFCQSEFKTPFEQCSPEQKQQVLSHFEEKAKHSYLTEKVRERYIGISFFRLLKTYTVYSYCISQKGATIGLNYIEVPGKYLPCTELEAGQKSWATK